MIKGNEAALLYSSFWFMQRFAESMFVLRYSEFSASNPVLSLKLKFLDSKLIISPSNPCSMDRSSKGMPEATGLNLFKISLCRS
jgi:hypothetical protein